MQEIHPTPTRMLKRWRGYAAVRWGKCRFSDLHRRSTKVGRLIVSHYVAKGSFASAVQGNFIDDAVPLRIDAKQ